MKKCCILVLTAVLLACMCACVPSDPVLESLGEYQEKIMYTEGGFQDYTDYGIYTYAEQDAQTLQSNKYFSAIAPEDLENILSYLDDFESWVEVFRSGTDASELADHYQFDRQIINEGDYICIQTKEETSSVDSTYGKFDNYTVYFFDVETSTLYYFHNNS